MTNEPGDPESGAVLSEKIKIFEVAFKQHSELLYRYAYRKTNSIDISKDLVQESFFTLWDKQDKFPEADQILPYLYVILKNKILNQYKKSNIHLKYAISVAKQIPVQEDSSDQLLNKELESIVKEEVGNMPARMQEIYLLKKDDGISVREIAEKLDISEQTVKNQLQNAYNRIKIRLKDYDSFPLVLGFLSYLAPMLKYH
ncbi:MAG TPA: sigma-70 family RNA polymerase sigma factor [Pedobacter sp.]